MGKEEAEATREPLDFVRAGPRAPFPGPGFRVYFCLLASQAGYKLYKKNSRITRPLQPVPLNNFSKGLWIWLGLLQVSQPHKRGWSASLEAYLIQDRGHASESQETCQTEREEMWEKQPDYLLPRTNMSELSFNRAKIVFPCFRSMKPELKS